MQVILKYDFEDHTNFGLQTHIVLDVYVDRLKRGK